MGELLPYLKGEKSGKVVGITFDDGFRNNLTEALPILQQVGFSATCYIISQKIGGINEWDLDKGIPENPLMNNNEIQQWIDSGMEIGSHTRNHVRLTECDRETAQQEITQSKEELEQRFSTTVDHFCYPYGQYDNTIKELTKDAGYTTSTKVRRGLASPNHSLHELPRVSITHSTLPHLFLIKVLSQYEAIRGQ